MHSLCPADRANKNIWTIAMLKLDTSSLAKKEPKFYPPPETHQASRVGGLSSWVEVRPIERCVIDMEGWELILSTPHGEACKPHELRSNGERRAPWLGILYRLSRP